MEKMRNVSIVIKPFNIKVIGQFNHFAKSTQTICSKMPPVLKQKFISCGEIMPTRMLHMEMLGTGGPGGGPGVACSSQSGQNNLADGSMLNVHVPAFEPTQPKGKTK